LVHSIFLDSHALNFESREAREIIAWERIVANNLQIQSRGRMVHLDEKLIDSGKLVLWCAHEMSVLCIAARKNNGESPITTMPPIQ
jgi:hypothetical protein